MIIYEKNLFVNKKLFKKVLTKASIIIIIMITIIVIERRTTKWQESNTADSVTR